MDKLSISTVFLIFIFFLSTQKGFSQDYKTRPYPLEIHSIEITIDDSTYYVDDTIRIDLKNREKQDVVLYKGDGFKCVVTFMLKRKKNYVGLKEKKFSIVSGENVNQAHFNSSDGGSLSTWEEKGHYIHPDKHDAIEGVSFGRVPINQNKTRTAKVKYWRSLTY